MKDQKGVVLIYEIVIIFVFSLVMLAVTSYAVYQLKLVNSITKSEQAFQIAEAGVNYYQWHLAHYPTDYNDRIGGTGTITAGPYLHDYVDKDTQQVIGRFSLNITPPSVGSTIVTIQSTGYTLAVPTLTRTVTVRYGVPSLAQYGFMTNSFVRVGSGSTFFGRFHSNSGIEFNGQGNAPIASARATYTCQAGDGCSGTHNGIWGTAPAATQALWQFPVSNIDYSAITADLSTLRASAQSGGIYFAPSSANGYSLVFNANGTIRIYRVNSLRSHQTGYDVNGTAHNEDIDYGTSGGARTQLDGNPSLAGTQDFAMPTNGIMYLEDRTWVEGVVDGRVMVVAARLPYNSSTAPSIIIPNNLSYELTDGTDVLGLIGQKDVLLSYYVPDDLTVHAAFIAQNGSFQRYCFPNTEKDDLTVYGSISSAGRAAIYSSCSGDLSGYETRNYTYDANLLYGPPPGFPLSSEGYQQISWESD
jgi:hypothetical protein